MGDAQELELPIYSAPRIVRGIHSFLSAPRNFNTDDFSKLVSPDSNDRKDYYYGLIFVSVLIISVFLVWGSVLVMLKCMGNSVGCASGNSVGSIKHEMRYSGDTGSVASDISGSDDFLDEVEEDETVLDIRKLKRERRIRIAFGLAATVTVTCSIMALVWAYAPVKNSLEQSDESVAVSKEIIGDIHMTLESVSNEINSIKDTTSTDELNITHYCPNADPRTVEGVNLEAFGSLIENEHKEIELALENITSANRTVNEIEDVLDAVQRNINRANDSFWVIPGLLAAVCITTAIAFFGVVLAWKGKSGARTQRGMSYVILPLLIVFTVTCWILTLGAGVSAMTSGDACMEDGSPDATILNILDEYNVTSNDTIYNFVTNYTSGCIGEDPTVAISDIGEEIQEKTNMIWRHISVVDSVGREVISQACGNDIEELIRRARTVANSLLLIRKGLSRLTSSLECDRINAIYVRAVHESACTDAASGASWGLLLFFLISISTMVSVTLRAAFYQTGKEENMYEEEEVAENMVLDEHEEYLNYISKYKHEWQEYNGINATSIDVQNEDDEGSGGDFDEEELLDMDSRDYSDAEYDPDDRSQTPFSIGSDDISFPSLHAPSDGSQLGEATGPWIPPLLPPMRVAIPPNDDADSVDTAKISLPDFAKDERKERNASKVPSLLHVIKDKYAPDNEADQSRDEHHESVEVSIRASAPAYEEREGTPSPSGRKDDFQGHPLNNRREETSTHSDGRDNQRRSYRTCYDEENNETTSTPNSVAGNNTGRERSISFAMEDAAPTPDTNVSKKVDLFTKQFSVSSKPPTPGRKPRIKSNEAVFFG